jgi:hypothetical protein
MDRSDYAPYRARFPCPKADLVGFAVYFNEPRSGKKVPIDGWRFCPKHGCYKVKEGVA